MALLVDALYVFCGTPALQSLMDAQSPDLRDDAGFFMEPRVWSNPEDGLSHDVGALKLLFLLEMQAVAVENGMALADYLTVSEATFDKYWTVQRLSGVDRTAREAFAGLMDRGALQHTDARTQERLRNAVRAS